MQRHSLRLLKKKIGFRKFFFLRILKTRFSRILYLFRLLTCHLKWKCFILFLVFIFMSSLGFCYVLHKFHDLMLIMHVRKIIFEFCVCLSTVYCKCIARASFFPSSLVRFTILTKTKSSKQLNIGPFLFLSHTRCFLLFFNC